MAWSKPMATTWPHSFVPMPACADASRVYPARSRQVRLGGEHAAQYVLQDPAVAVVLRFARGVDAYDCVELYPAVGGDSYGARRHRVELLYSGNRERFCAGQAER